LKWNLSSCTGIDGIHTAGKHWHQTKTAFRPRANQSSFAKRTEERKALAAVKAKEKEMKDEKEAERQVRHTRLKLEV
jgi:rRNA-processing protein CGR1